MKKQKEAGIGPCFLKKTVLVFVAVALYLGSML